MATIPPHKLTILSLLVCRQVVENPDDTHDIQGVISHFSAPLMFPRLDVPVIVKYATEPYTLILRLVHRGSLTILGEAAMDTIVINNPYAVGHLTFRLANVMFVEQGLYDFQLWNSDSLLCEYSVIAH